MEHLTKKQESFCENGGIFGALISLTCLIQHLVFMVSGWIAYSFIPVYLLSIIGFVLLAKKSYKSYRVILISTILIFVVEAFMIMGLVFSLILLILWVYSVLIIVFMKVDNIQNQLHLKEKSDKAEREKWNGIIN